MADAELSILDRLSEVAPEQRRVWLYYEGKRLGISTAEVTAMVLREWRYRARPKQLEPEGNWTFWFLMSGRGFGKTLSAAEWAAKMGRRSKIRFAVVAPTFPDVRATCFEGETGLLNVFKPHELMGGNRETAYNESLFELTLSNGTLYKGYSAEVPNRLRGPQHHFAWLEEVSSFPDARKGDEMDTCWSNLKLGLRLGHHPRAVLTSTPKANKLTRHLVALDSVKLVKGSSYENRENLSEIWWQTVVAPLEGTRTGRQEILAELLTDVEGALWSMGVIDACRTLTIPGTDIQARPGWQSEPELREIVGSRMRRIIVGVDPNTTSGESSDAAGVVVAGLGEDNEGYVLDDRTVVRGGPSVWRAAAVDAYHDWQADKIVAEVNNGGEMVDLVIKGWDPTVPVEMVHASRGKRTRAEPVASLYFTDEEHDKAATVHHIGSFPDMEDEMCLAGTVLVATSRGEVPIMQVTRGDLVLTRDGFAPVEWAGQTGFTDELVSVLYAGRSLDCTPCHPIYDSAKDAFVSAGSVRRGLHLTALRDLTSASAHLLSGGGAGGTGCGRATSVDTPMVKLSCIASSGRRIAARSLLDSKYIIGTATPATTRSRTWRRSPAENTRCDIPHQASLRGRANSDEPTRSPSGSDSGLTVSSAPSVELASSQLGLAPCIAPVAVNDVRRIAARRLPVFNLKVRDGFLPEFFANGVLVHNCTWTPAEESPNRMDALVWAMTRLRIWQPPAPAKSGVAEGDIPGIVTVGEGLLDSPY